MVGLDAVVGNKTVAGLLILAPREVRRRMILFSRRLGWCSGMGPKLREAGKTRGAVLVSVSGMDGCFGFERAHAAMR